MRWNGAGFLNGAFGILAAMIDPKNIEQVLSSLRQAIPGGLAGDVERHVRASLEALFARLDLVTREELAVQEAVLLRTRERLEQLEKLVAALEQRLAARGPH
jgi:hypothetical protein